MTESGTAPRRECATPFSRILSDLEGESEGFETAVFFDGQGEAIDFYTVLDPFAARLVAAYHVVLFLSAKTRLAWLGAGRVAQLEIGAEKRESLTMPVGDDYYVTAVVRAGCAGEALSGALFEVAAKLREEAGL